MLDYLDEETVIWEQDPKKKLSEVSSDKPAVFRTPDATQMEFLKHFDKSENQLINISAELLAVTLKIDSLPEPDDIAELREQLVTRISDLKDKASHLNYPVAVIDKLCFLFAVVLDEFIVYTDWGEKRCWENKTLLSELFGMRNGGELFFSVAEKAVRQPNKMIDLIEIIYLFLSIGFKGQYHSQGSEQLKRFIHQLEQILSQYRQSTRIHCQTRVAHPKVRRPSRKKRYAVISLLFATLIGSTLTLTYFWYSKTLPQRSRDFTYLPDFSQRYILSGQVNDIVFISSDSDLSSPPIRGSRVEAQQSPRVAASPISKDSKLWLVQLATFSNEQNAQLFIERLSASKYEPRVDSYKQYFRVVVDVDDRSQAIETQKWLKDNQNIDSIVIKTNKKQ